MYVTDNITIKCCSKQIVVLVEYLYFRKTRVTLLSALCVLMQSHSEV